MELRSCYPARVAPDVPTGNPLISPFYQLTALVISQVLILLRHAAHDTVLTTTSIDGKNTLITVPVPQGTQVIVSIAGLHYNRQFYLSASHIDK